MTNFIVGGHDSKFVNHPVYRDYDPLTSKVTLQIPWGFVPREVVLFRLWVVMFREVKLFIIILPL